MEATEKRPESNSTAETFEDLYSNPDYYRELLRDEALDFSKPVYDEKGLTSHGQKGTVVNLALRVDSLERMSLEIKRVFEKSQKLRKEARAALDDIESNGLDQSDKIRRKRLLACSEHLKTKANQLKRQQEEDLGHVATGA